MAKGNAEHERLIKEIDDLAASGSDPCLTFLNQARTDLKRGDVKDALKVLAKYAECEQRELDVR